MFKKIHTHLFRRKTKTKTPSELMVGWQEWCALPKLHIPAIKAKIDTGAKTSALHAWNVRSFYRHNELYVHFILHPLQKNIRVTQTCTARVVDQRVISSSTGQKELRYIISSTIMLGEKFWEIELSLTNRDTMAFRMLLGRDALKNHAIINPAKILCQGRYLKRQLRELYPRKKTVLL